MKTSLFTNCPVCEMELHDQTHMSSYLSIDYYFCSEQCSEAFKQHPHLYLGRPGGKKSIKKRGRQVIKNRKLPYLDKSITRNEINNALTETMGIKEILHKKDCFYIQYDLIEVTWKEILSCLEKKNLMKHLNPLGFHSPPLGA